MAGRWVVIAAAGLLLLGAALALVARPTASPPAPAAAAAPEGEPPVRRAELEEVLAALEFERQARRALAEEVAELRRALEAERSAAPGGGAGSEDAPAAGAQAARGAEASEDTSAGGPAFDAEALVAAGVSALDADRLRESWEAHELAKLELTNRALREGWRRPRIYGERLALDAALRAELADQYDAYLYATGQENRLVVEEVLEGSAAGAAGFEEDDMILSYDGERVYAPAELRRTTASCRPGAYVSVAVIRSGQRDTLRAPCGPLGVLLDHARRPP